MKEIAVCCIKIELWPLFFPFAGKKKKREKKINITYGKLNRKRNSTKHLPLITSASLQLIMKHSMVLVSFFFFARFQPKRNL